MSSSANLRQNHYRFRSDTGTVDGTPTWYASEDTNINIDVTGGNTKFRLRVAVQETAGTSDSASTFQIRSNLDAYATAIITSDTGVRSADVSSDASGTNATVSRLTGTGSFITGEYDEDGTSDSVTITANNYTEFEWGLEIVAADVTDGQILDFRVYRAAALNTYTVTPRITVSKSPAFGSHKNSSVQTAALASAASTTFLQDIVVAVGDLIVVAGVSDQGNGANSISSVQDSLSNSWSALTSATSTNNLTFGYYSYVTVAGETTITVNAANTNGARLYLADVFAATFASSPLDQNPAVNPDATTPTIDSSATGTLTQADELLVGYCGVRQGAAVLTATSPFSLAQAANFLNDSSAIMYDVVSSTSTVTGQFGTTNATSGLVGIATFMKAAAAADTLFAQAIM